MNQMRRVKRLYCGRTPLNGLGYYAWVMNSWGKCQAGRFVGWANRPVTFRPARAFQAAGLGMVITGVMAAVSVVDGDGSVFTIAAYGVIALIGAGMRKAVPVLHNEPSTT